MENKNCTLIKNSELVELRKPLDDLKKELYSKDCEISNLKRQIRVLENTPPEKVVQIDPMKLEIQIARIESYGAFNTHTYSLIKDLNIDLHYPLRNQIIRIVNKFIQKYKDNIKASIEYETNRFSRNIKRELVKEILNTKWYKRRKLIKSYL